MKLVEILAIAAMGLAFIIIFVVPLAVTMLSGKTAELAPVGYTFLLFAVIFLPVYVFYVLAKAKGEIKEFPKPSGKIKFCRKCGTKASFYDRFCTGCGGKINS